MKCSYVTTGVREGHVKSKCLSLRRHHKLDNQSKGTKTRYLVVQIENNKLKITWKKNGSKIRWDRI